MKTIFDALNASQLQHVQECKTSKDAWNILESLHGACTSLNGSKQNSNTGLRSYNRGSNKVNEDSSSGKEYDCDELQEAYEKLDQDHHQLKKSNQKLKTNIKNLVDSNCEFSLKMKNMESSIQTLEKENDELIDFHEK